MRRARGDLPIRLARTLALPVCYELSCTGNAKGLYVLFAEAPHFSLHKKSPVKQPHLIEASQDTENV